MSVTFSESEIKMLSRAWLCVEGGMPKIDYEKLATETGLAKSSVGVLWPKLRRKMENANENGGATEGGTPVKKTPKKRAATDGTPKKRGRKSKAAVPAAAVAEEDEDEEIGSPKKKVKKEIEEDDGVGKLLSGAKEYSKREENSGLIGADSDDEV